MNRTIMILHLLVSISVARPIGENPSPIIKDQNFETDDLVPRSPDEIEDVLILVKKDDILTTSDINRIYNLLENKLGQIRSLKEEPDNEGYKNAELEHQSRVAVKLKPTENVKPDEKSDTTDKVEELENRAANSEESELEGKIGRSERLISNENMALLREESKLSEENEEIKSGNTSGRTTIQLEEKNYATEAGDFQSKGSTKEKRKSEVTKELNELKSTTEAFRSEDNAPEYLENDSDIYEPDSRRSGTVITDQKSESYQNDRAEVNDKSDFKENSKVNRNDKVKNDGKRAPIENSRSSYLKAKVKTINRQASKEDSRSGYRNDNVETNDKRAPKEESRSGYRNDEDDSYGKTAIKNDKERKGYEMPINDESNSSWDLLDDIPISRRMLTHDNFDVEIKGKAADEDDELEEDRNASESKASRNENSYGPTTPQYDRTVSKPELQSTVSIPQHQTTIRNPVQRTVLNPQNQNTAASEQIQPGWNPQLQSTVPNSQFQTALNLQTQNTVSNRQFEHTVLNPQFPSTILNTQFQTVLNPQTQNTAPRRQFESTALNPQFPSTALNPQFPSTGMNPQFPSTALNPQLPSTALNPHFKSTSLNSQFQAIPHLQFHSSVLNPQFRSTVSIPHIHPSLSPVRRFIIPGIIKTRPAKPIDKRRFYSQEENNTPHQLMQHKTDRNTNENVNYRNDDRSEIVESRNIEDNSNAYPYTPMELEKKENTPQIAIINPIFSKLVEASEHPQRFNPNFNGGNVQNFPYYKKLNRFQLF